MNHQQILRESITRKFKNERLGVMVDAFKDLKLVNKRLRFKLGELTSERDELKHKLESLLGIERENELLRKRVKKLDKKYNIQLDVNKKQVQVNKELRLTYKDYKEKHEGSLEYIAHLESKIYK